MLIQNVLNILRGFDRFPLQRPTLSSYVFFLPVIDLVTNWGESQFGFGSLLWWTVWVFYIVWRVYFSHSPIHFPSKIEVDTYKLQYFWWNKRIDQTKICKIRSNTSNHKLLTLIGLKKENRRQIWPSLLITQPTLALNNIKARPTGLAVSAICYKLEITWKVR